MEILVLGMHRSGTSMITRLLNLAGAYFGPDHQHTGKNAENPKGFWERKDVRALNDLLLHATDAEWDRPLKFDRNRLTAQHITEFETGANKILAECRQHECWVIKEPRLCLTLPLWQPLLSNPIIVWVHRHPMEIALSLQKRNGFPLSYSLALWEWYTLQTGRHIRGEKVVITFHEDMLANPTANLNQLLGNLRTLGCSQLTMPKSATVLGFIDKKLHRARMNDLPANIGMTQAQKDLWQRVRKSPADASTWPEHVSEDCMQMLHLGEVTSASLLKRLKEVNQQRDRFQTDRDRWVDQAQKRHEHNQKLHKELQELTTHSHRIMGRLRELEQAWKDLHKSNLWKLGLGVNRIRGFFSQTKPTTSVSPTKSLEKPTPSLTKAITVIVPIFNAFDKVKQCLESLLKSTHHPHRLLLIDDASTESGLTQMLDQFGEDKPHVFLIRHTTNGGYTSSINEGLAWAGEDDVVLLNSDTIVPDGWLRQLQRTSNTKLKVATVTPLSNAAGAFSIPRNNQVNALPKGYTVNDFATLVAQLSNRKAPEVPTGNGFCLYIRREAITAVGLFDNKAFPRGYGEENDFCMRASQAGFIHLIDDANFVFHHRNASFGSEKKALIENARQILANRWPQYKTAVNQWQENDCLNPFREQLRHHLAKTSQPALARSKTASEPILFVLHAGGGGTRLTSADLIAALPARFPCFMLITGRHHWQLLTRANHQLKLLHRWDFDQPWQLQDPPDSIKLALLRRICSHFGIRLAHVRHFLGNAPEIVPTLREMCISVIISFHDFYTICPNIQLLDRSGRFCAGDCHGNDQHASQPGFHRWDHNQDCAMASNWFQDPPMIRHHYVHQWRDRVSQALAGIQAAVTTSKASKAMILRHFPQLDTSHFELIEHGRDFSKRPNIAEPPGPDPVNMICFGALNHSKGLATIAALAQLDKPHGRFQFHLLGHVAADWYCPSDGIHLHGPYDHAQLFQQLADLKPALVLIPSLWPETYCHTLTEAWAAGIPVICSDIGTLRERVLSHGGGWLADPYKPQAWYDLLVQICDQPEAYQEKLSQVKQYQPRPIATMAEAYAQLYDRVLARPNPFIRKGATAKKPQNQAE